MMAKFIYVILCLAVLRWFECNSAPVEYSPFQVFPVRFLPQLPSPQAPQIIPQNNPKVVWNFVGDIIGGSGFLPIHINVPDTVASVTGGAQNIVQGIAMAAGNLLQRIPFVTRLTRPERPRPLRVLVVDEHGQVVGMMNTGEVF